jgi:CheY-like chemotaxis protein
MPATVPAVAVGMTDIKKSFGTSARMWRSRRGISQEELAERAGLHRTYVSDIERGARNPSLESINKLADALGISIAAFFSATPDAPAGRRAPSANAAGEILFVEDDPHDVELTLDALKQANITNPIRVIRDGAEALDYLFHMTEHVGRRRLTRPQMILLDLNLPKVDGLEVLRRIKADPRTRMIPVAVLTGSRNDRDLAASKKLGAEAFIVKPVDFQNFSAITPQMNLHWALLKRRAPPNS